MKKLESIFLIILFLLCFTCKKEEAPPIGDSYSQVKGIQDDWLLTKVEIVDEVADPETAIDVSDLMVGATPSEIHFTADTYTINPGTSRHFIPFTGSWRFNDNQYPTELILIDNTIEITLNHLKPVREIVDHILQYKFLRLGDVCAREYQGKAVASYIYTYYRK